MLVFSVPASHYKERIEQHLLPLRGVNKLVGSVRFGTKMSISQVFRLVPCFQFWALVVDKAQEKSPRTYLTDSGLKRASDSLQNLREKLRQAHGNRGTRALMRLTQGLGLTQFLTCCAGENDLRPQTSLF